MLSFLLTMHAGLLVTNLIVLGALVVWGLVGALRGWAPGRSYMALLAIDELLLLSQFVLGVLLALSGRQAARPALHVVYGVVAVVAIPAAHLYIRGRAPRQRRLVYAGACLFVCAVLLRTLATGR